jgi:DNA-binding SARP family transcriptional activator
MGALRFSLFGKLRAQIGEYELADLDVRKAQELLCYLLLQRNRPHAREALAALFWGDATTTQSKKYLRQALWQLQSWLESRQAGVQAALFTTDPEWIYVELQPNVWIDVMEFEAAFASVRETPGQQLTAEQAEKLKQALPLYRADLLEGWYSDWCIYERERLQTMYLAILERLMGFCEAQREYETGVFYGLQILRYDRARESTHRRLMRLHTLAGDRTAALRQYQVCVSALADELDVEPAASTTTLYQMIRTDQFDEHIPTLSPGRRAASSVDAPWLAAMDRLKQLQHTLAGLNGQIDQCVQAFEQALSLQD